MKSNDLTGQRFGKLICLERVGSTKSGHARWKCKCDCGKEKIVLATNLKMGHTTSCGCAHAEKVSKAKTIDLTGQRFGKLVVLQRVSPIGDSHMHWKCKCDCGKEVIVRGTALKQGITKSCGCMRSAGEFAIRQILDSLNIKYKQEYAPKDLLNRRFDFAILDDNDNVLQLIEFDGKQHFVFENSWGLTKEEWKLSIQRDKEKDEYCKSHNIPLVRIPYWELSKINNEYIMNKLQEAQEYE